MKSRNGWIALVLFALVFSPLAARMQPAAMAQEEASADQDLMTEAELASMLVNVLGMATMVPPNAQPADVYAILLQNGISPKDGWNPTNLVTIGNLARIMVQCLGDTDKIENPESDKSWVDYLKSIGVEFGTIEDAIAQIDTKDDVVALKAVEVSTDPLRKAALIRPVDEQQLGADLQFFNRTLSREDVLKLFPQPEPVPPPAPPKPRPVTPNAPRR
ncbi:MAG TPA: hypothetical protein PKC67_13280 [Kiritimatiellia bacterium]|nr:hypothetical protein [Kiritimatiellia bacterium]HMP35309.1 hypothetical protein [Kiritimatiellia bacterium]